MPMASLALKPKSHDFASMLVGGQIRAARALLKWSAHELARRCGVSYPALQKAAAADGIPSMNARNLAAIQDTLERAGVVFIDADDKGGPGVRLKR